MSVRHSSSQSHGLAPLLTLRYSLTDVDGEASNCHSDGLDLVGGLCDYANAGGSYAGAGRCAVRGVCFGGELGRGRGFVQRVVAYVAYHEPGGIERILDDGGPLVGRGAYVHVPG